ncbi:hypothetical protein ABOM_001301 [Aspergillus bombycis]|uniref:Uncharacterized protein n=1 Tax=Aspergillus bombycis TaxID=109264 RepID=A0A1F8AF66_9EURO|nr:hypothetical protein ABOM_001301 [Aspergillus bombycis]OGM49968.1 hypothetical protein ABOM_001301 [Aspergillus bombycis]
MSEDSHPQHHQGFFDRILHPGHHHQEQEQHQGHQESQGDEAPKKESEFDKIKEDIKEDQEEVAEGDTYAGLM